jgi:dihydrofolate reductase
MNSPETVISLIWAMSENRVIGRGNKLPWHLPADLQHFKLLTLGKPIVMGRMTWESLPGVLPKRRHIVLSRDKTYVADGCTVVHSLEEALVVARGVPEVMVVGGAALYEAALPKADRLYLTLVHTEVDGDTYFPRFDLSDWRELEREPHSADKNNPYPYSFITLARENFSSHQVKGENI